MSKSGFRESYLSTDRLSHERRLPVVAFPLFSSGWQPSVILNEDIVEKVAHIKQQEGPDLHVWGSGNLIQTLLKHGLVDVF